MTMPINDNSIALWDPAEGRVYTFMLPYDGEDQPLRCAFGRETLAELLHKGAVSPESVLLPWLEAWPLQEAADKARYCKGPQRIDAERFDEMLNCLPPQRWTRWESTESFRVCEAVTGNLYTFGVRIKDTYFSLTADGFTSHDDLIKQCQVAS